MSAPITPTQLRSNLYRVLDEVAETGTPQEIVRGERRLLIVPADGPRFRIADLARRQALLNCTPDELVAISWEGSSDG
jgi:hypothetical protein